MYMARKRSGEQLEKNISSVISLGDFEFLERYTRFYYNNGTLKQPTISHLVRFVLKSWIIFMRKKQEENRINRSKEQAAWDWINGQNHNVVVYPNVNRTLDNVEYVYQGWIKQGLMEFHNYGFSHKKFKVLFAVGTLMGCSWGRSDQFEIFGRPYRSSTIKIISFLASQNKAIINNNSSMLSCLRPNGLLLI